MESAEAAREEEKGIAGGGTLALVSHQSEVNDCGLILQFARDQSANCTATGVWLTTKRVVVVRGRQTSFLSTVNVDED
jgi:hypothetical protein